ncbi:hypothetical protein Tco_1346448 [Tanacetum coccineum]
MLWEWRGIANMDFIQLGGSSRVDEMILARVRSGFAGEKVWDDHQVVPGKLPPKKDGPHEATVLTHATIEQIVGL